MERWTLLRILKWTADYFGERGIDSPRLDAELLLAAALGLDRVGLYLNYDRPLTDTELDRFRDSVKRRAGHEPVQYILGSSEFWSLRLQIDRQVLIPRADTEVLVEEVLALMPNRPLRLLDVGTGSGAIAIALAHERPGWLITAVDISPAALNVARTNSALHNLTERIDFLEGDLAELPPGPFEMVVSNPPYIPSGDLDALMPEVRDHEPRLALDGGPDGLAAYRMLTGQAGRILAPGGWLAVEVGIGQAETVTEMFLAAGLEQVSQRDDYGGRPRVVKGCRKTEHG